MDNIGAYLPHRDTMLAISESSPEIIVKTPNGSAISAQKVSKVEITIEEQKKDENIYYIELMVSSGPRKDVDTYRSNAAYRELGEDAGGVLSLPGIYLFWIADGTSDQKALYDFSSRILAQDLGICFKKCACNMFLENGIIDFGKLIEETFKYLESEWEQRLSKKWTNLTLEEKEKFTSLLPCCGDGALRISWSSTFLAGVINFNEEKLQCLNIGDAGGLVCYKNDSKKDIVPPKRGRCFMSLEHYPKNGGYDTPTISPKLDEYLFSWDNIPGNDESRLLKYLGWPESANIDKSDDRTICITFKEEKSSAKITIDENMEKATLSVTNNRTCNLKVKKENNELRIYENNIVEFDQVESFMFMTDGNTRRPLKEFLDSRASVDMLVQINRLRESTGDDKCVLIGSKIKVQR